MGLLLFRMGAIKVAVGVVRLLPLSLLVSLLGRELRVEVEEVVPISEVVIVVIAATLAVRPTLRCAAA